MQLKTVSGVFGATLTFLFNFFFCFYLYLILPDLNFNAPFLIWHSNNIFFLTCHKQKVQMN